MSFAKSGLLAASLLGSVALIVAPAQADQATHWPVVQRVAAENGVPAALVHAVVMVESRYNARAYGRGTYGLMQIKLPTARSIGYSGSGEGLYDPETNLRFGVKYLAGAYRLAAGDTCGTIMRYAGGHRATRLSKSSAAYCAKVKRYMAEAPAAAPVVIEASAQPQARPVQNFFAALFAPRRMRDVPTAAAAFAPQPEASAAPIAIATEPKQAALAPAVQALPPLKPAAE